MSDLTPQSCRSTALGLLARREHSTKELLQKLIIRGYDQPDVVKVVEQLVQERLLSDERFAESYAYSRSKKGIGPVRLRKELRERGIENELIGCYLEGVSWYSLAAAARQKKFGVELPNDRQEQTRQMRFLQYRGFTTDQVRSVLKSNDWE